MYEKLKTNGIYSAYVRKSRADIELERIEKFDTLKRHEDMLIQLAKHHDITIKNTYKEVVSGETIQDRPEMQKLLKEVENGVLDGVLVIEIERLSRGDGKDQAEILRAFKFNNVKIITLNKIYDPNNDDDEEYFEFGLYMSRREFKTINRRLQRGREVSVTEGKYIGSSQPFGYKKVKLKGQKGFTLEQVEKEAEIVKELFKRRINGATFISLSIYMNTLDVKPLKSEVWTPATITRIIENPIYAGKLTRNARYTDKILINGVITKKRIRTPQSQWIFIEALHEPIISFNEWQKAQKVAPKTSRVNSNNVFKNPLASLIKCGNCERTMQRRPNNKNLPVSLICPKRKCETVGNDLDIIEETLLEGLKQKLIELKNIPDHYSNFSTNNEDLDKVNFNQKELNKINSQLDKAYNLVEQEIYSPAEFVERTKKLKQEKKSVEAELRNLKTKNNYQSIEEAIPKLEKVINSYSSISDLEARNKLLKTIVDYAVYNRVKRNHYRKYDFSLEIKLKI